MENIGPAMDPEAMTAAQTVLKLVRTNLKPFCMVLGPMLSVLLLLAAWGCCLHSAPSLSRAGGLVTTGEAEGGPETGSAPLFYSAVRMLSLSLPPPAKFQNRAADLVGH